ncbi:hypothetical protein [Saccharothrix texasensis]|uniref:hypothetical protein n=1 Tax=Saccharothrix texasensis TaxID=103734 RepID=UPI0014778899|nr:hypothetical protein [Saccharothrix texasensis]
MLVETVGADVSFAVDAATFAVTAAALIALGAADDVGGEHDDPTGHQVAHHAAGEREHHHR